MNWYKKAQIDYSDSWCSDSKVVDTQGNLLTVYHGTNATFDKFDLDKSTMGNLWFTSNKDSIIEGESGACGNNIIKAVNLCIRNPAGWAEYDKYSVGELIGLGFDGIILDDNYVVWDVSQVRIIDQNVLCEKNNELV